jgi:hypothetical protein
MTRAATRWRNPAASSIKKMRRECPPPYGGDECNPKNLSEYRDRC